MAKENNKPDLVIKFQNLSQENAEEVAQYIADLKAKGFGHELIRSFNGKDVYCLLTCQDDRLVKEIKKEYVTDLLAGIGIYYELEESSVSAQNLPVSHRLRLCKKVIDSVKASIDSQVFALHNKHFNENWLKSLRTKNYLNLGDLTEIRDQFGHSIAFYFDFLQFYFVALSVPSVFSLLMFFFNWQFSSFHALVVAVWGLIFVEVWDVREKDLSAFWGTQGVSKEEELRIEFVPDISEKNLITGEMENKVSIAKSWVRSLKSAAIITLLGTILTLLILVIFCIQLAIDKAYGGPFKDYITFAPTILYVALIPQFTSFYQKTAEKLTEYENPKTKRAFNDLFIQKSFVATAIINFSSPLLYGLLFVPFGAFILSLFDFVLPVKDFVIDAEVFKGQVVYFIVTGQILNFFMETVVPLITRHVLHLFNGKKEQPAENKSNEAHISKQVQSEAELPEYNVNEDYSEMVLQFGYVVLFSCVYPLVPVFAFINNYVEVRSDAFKICVNAKRPLPTREESIGPWLSNMKLLVWFSFIANAVWTSLYCTKVDFKDTNLWLNTFIAVFVWERLYFLLRYIVSSIISSFPTIAKDKAKVSELKKRQELLQVTSPTVANIRTSTQANFDDNDFEKVKREIRSLLKTE